MNRRLIKPKPVETVSIRIEVDREDYLALKRDVQRLIAEEPEADRLEHEAPGDTMPIDIDDQVRKYAAGLLMIAVAGIKTRQSGAGG